MEKRAIVSFAVGSEDFRDVTNITFPRFKKYAEKCGADFIELSPWQCLFPAVYWNKFLIYGLFEKYDRILWLDADILVANHAPNIFDHFPISEIGMCDEARYFPQRLMQMCKYLGAVDYEFSLTVTPEKYYNVGVMIIPREKSFILSIPRLFPGSPMPEQDHINFMALVTGTGVTDIGFRWNHLTGIGEPDREDSYFIHFSNLLPAKDLELIKKYAAKI